jgi:ribosome maturation factor RimP
MSDTNTLERVARLIAPIVSDLHMDLYDLEFRGGTLRVTVDRAAGFEGGLDLEAISLASRLIGRELDHEDPMAGHYTLEVSSPGLERSLRTPAHFSKSVGQKVAVRLRDIDSSEGEARRIQGVLSAADHNGITVRTDDGGERSVPYHKIDRARTVFEWGPAPKPGSAKKKSPGKESSQ